MTDRKARFVCSAIFLLLLLAGRGVLAADYPIGTVFYSPKERVSLVARRNGATDEMVAAEEKKFEQEKDVSEGKGAEEAAKSLPYAVSGIVSRSGGKSVVWLNGQPVDETPHDASLPPIRLSSDHAVIDGKSVKVGETLDTLSGESVAPLPAGAVKVVP